MVQIHKSMAGHDSAVAVFVNHGDIGSLLRIFLYLFDSVSKRETAVSHYTDTVYKSVNLLVHIETASTAGDLCDRKSLGAVKDLVFKVLRDRHNIINFPVKKAVLQDAFIIGYILDIMIYRKVFCKSFCKSAAGPG